MRYADGMFAVAAVALSSLVLAGVVHSDDYALAAQAEAYGYDALTQRVWGEVQLCDNRGARAASPQ